MKVQWLAAGLLLSGLVAVTACGEDPPSSALKPAAPSGGQLSAWQVYYEQTHPEPRPSGQVSAWQIYYEQTHPDQPSAWSGDVKDHPGYQGGIAPDQPAAWSGDVKDHPGYQGGIAPDQPAAWSGDVKDHPGYRVSAGAQAANEQHERFREALLEVYGGDVSDASWSGDVKDHPGYRGGVPRDHPHYEVRGRGSARSIKAATPGPEREFSASIAGRITYG